MRANRYEDGTHEMDFLTVALRIGFLAKNLREIAWASDFGNKDLSVCGRLRILFYLPSMYILFRGLETALVHDSQIPPYNPASWSFYSVSPFKYGDKHIVKYHFLPENPNILSSGHRNPSEALTESLKNGDVVYGLYVQFQPTDVKKYNVENVWDMWDDAGQPLHRVATLTLQGGQDSLSPEAAELGQTLWFNPWFTSAAHAPLGQFNHIRHRSYIAVGAFRERRLGKDAPPACPFFRNAA